MQTPSKLRTKPGAAAVADMQGKRFSTSSMSSSGIPKGFSEVNAIALLDAMLQAGKRPESAKKEESEKSVDIFEADHTVINFDDDLSKEIKQAAKKLSKATTFIAKSHRQSQSKNPFGAYGGGKATDNLLQQPLRASIIFEQAQSEGQSSSANLSSILSDSVKDLKKEESVEELSKTPDLLLKNMNDLVEITERKMTKMCIETTSIQFPPDCNVKLHPLLDTDGLTAWKNLGLRNKLQVQVDGTGFKLKANKELLRHIEMSFQMSEDIIDGDGMINLVKLVSDLLRQSLKHRSTFLIGRMVPLMRTIPFFKDRGLKDNSITDVLSLMTYKEMKKDEFVIEYGTFGEDFYVILEGQCEVLVPDIKYDEDFKTVTKEMKQVRANIEKYIGDIQRATSYQAQLQQKRKEEAEASEIKAAFGIERRQYSISSNQDLIMAIQTKKVAVEEQCQLLERFQWRKIYELMQPVLLLGPGKSFGELAVQKELNTKIAHLAKARKATVLCRTDCKFAVMSKSDYQSVLDNIDRRKVDKLREFFKQIPFFKLLPRAMLNTLHLCLNKKRYQRGQVVCKEGADSDHIYIIFKGEFEVSKVIDLNYLANSEQKTQQKIKRQFLPKRKLAQQTGTLLKKSDFGNGIASTKMEYSQKEAAFWDFKKLNIALIGEGQIHGEDDAIAMRPYQASLVCNIADSELLVLTRVDFYRIFKYTTESWKNAVKIAQAKEREYIGRCQHYLHFTRKIEDSQIKAVKSAQQVPQIGGRSSVLIDDSDDRRCKALLDRDNTQAYIERFDHRQRLSIQINEQASSSEEENAHNLTKSHTKKSMNNLRNSNTLRTSQSLCGRDSHVQSSINFQNQQLPLRSSFVDKTESESSPIAKGKAIIVSNKQTSPVEKKKKSLRLIKNAIENDQKGREKALNRLLKTNQSSVALRQKNSILTPSLFNPGCVDDFNPSQLRMARSSVSFNKVVNSQRSENPLNQDIQKNRSRAMLIKNEHGQHTSIRQPGDTIPDSILTTVEQKNLENKANYASSKHLFTQNPVIKQFLIKKKSQQQINVSHNLLHQQVQKPLQVQISHQKLQQKAILNSKINIASHDFGTDTLPVKEPVSTGSDFNSQSRVDLGFQLFNGVETAVDIMPRRNIPLQMKLKTEMSAIKSNQKIGFQTMNSQQSLRSGSTQVNNSMCQVPPIQPQNISLNYSTELTSQKQNRNQYAQETSTLQQYSSVATPGQGIPFNQRMRSTPGSSSMLRSVVIQNHTNSSGGQTSYQMTTARKNNLVQSRPRGSKRPTTQTQKTRAQTGRKTRPGVISEDGYPMQFSLTNGNSRDRFVSVACTFSGKPSAQAIRFKKDKLQSLVFH